jgi:hypothetical protein
MRHTLFVPARHRRRVLSGWAARTLLVALLTLVLVTVTAQPGWAQPPAPPQPASLEQVVNNLRLWIMGIIAAIATLFLVVGGLRYITAGGDPAEVERAKGNLKSALLGYALAVLAPILLTILQSILGI